MKRLWFKIFFLLVTANIALVGLLYWGFTWSFELAFERYLKDEEQSRFQPLMVAIAEVYSTKGNWTWVKGEHRIWQQLMREYVVDLAPNNEGPRAEGSPLLRPPGNGGGPVLGPGERRPPPRRELEFATTTGYNPHVMLFDQNHKAVIGIVHAEKNVYKYPIESEGAVVGYLGIFADSSLMVAMRAVMENQNSGRLFIIVGSLFVLSSFVAFFLATWLTVRIFRLKSGTSALVRGQYDHRIEVNGKDALEDLAHDFNGLAEALDKNRTAHQRWIASTSHELRTPVTILQGQIDALRDGIRQVTPEYLDSLSGDIDRLNLLIDDLHQLSMSDMGALNYQKDEIDLAELVDDELEKLNQLLPHEMTLDWNIDATSNVCILGDSPRLGQMIKNLMQNSIRYTDAPGSIKVSIVSTQKTVSLHWQDSSPGVGEDELEQLIEPLYRTESSRSRKVGGSGLGLAIVKAIVGAHDGSLTAKPSPIGGLLWEITFPVLNS